MLGMLKKAHALALVLKPELGETPILTLIFARRHIIGVRRILSGRNRSGTSQPADYCHGCHPENRFIN